jgi:hypothetical protein
MGLYPGVTTKAPSLQSLYNPSLRFFPYFQAGFDEIIAPMPSW